MRRPLHAPSCAGFWFAVSWCAVFSLVACARGSTIFASDAADGIGGSSDASSSTVSFEVSASAGGSSVVAVASSTVVAASTSNASSSATTGTGGCVPPLVDCGAGCIDTTADPENCGGCARPCAAGEACSASVCVTTTQPGSCDATDCNNCLNCAIAPGGACAAASDACLQSADCNDFMNCQDACTDVTCAEQCATTYPNGYTVANAMIDCAFCTGCATSCAGQDPNCP